MRKILSLILSAALSLSVASCSATTPEPEASYETVSETITFTVPSVQTSYPAENPPANAQPLLDEGEGQSAASSVDAEPDTEDVGDAVEPADEPQEGEDTPNSASSQAAESASSQSSDAVETLGGQTKEVRAVWLSYLEFLDLLQGRTADQFTANIRTAFDRIEQAGFNTVFAQVRPYGDALYPSDYFPWSYVASGTEGVDPGFDPLAIMVEEAHSRGLRIEAWINPYRVRTDTKEPLSEDNQALLWAEAGEGDAVWFEGGLYYNPGSEKAQELIVQGVREILENYDVDGIHFDDYFYPTTSSSFDEDSYAAYKENGGKLTLGNWRRENVNTLVQKVYATVKELKPNAVFGISPQGNNQNNYDKQYADTAKWLSEEGYVDYICPQVYFGFENGTAPFKSTVEEWNALIQNDKIKLYVGLAPYKLGVRDQWAGAGENEWIGTTDLLCQMVEAAREMSHYGGFSMFRYASLFEPGEQVKEQVETELDSLTQLLQ